MSVRYLTDIDGRVALFDSVTDIAFGPVLQSPEHADDFLSWIARDPRTLPSSRLLDEHARWSRARVNAEGELRE